MSRVDASFRFEFSPRKSQQWLWVIALSLCLVQARAQANPSSPLMTNLSSVNYYTSEQPFLDVFKTDGRETSYGAGLQRGWLTQNRASWDTGEEGSLQLDANGWPKSVIGARGTKFTRVGVLLERQGGTAKPPYPAGQYVVLYDGRGRIKYGLDAWKNLALSAPGRDVIKVTPSDAGILLQITSTDPHHTGNYIRNIRIVQAAYESDLKAGQIFNPRFLAMLRPFRGYRFMDWMETNNSTQSAWADRPLPTDAFWGTMSGVPVEVMVALLNQQKADGWFNMPVRATDDYVTKFAALVHSALNARSKVYVEYSNEVWNFGFLQYHYAYEHGNALWPNSSNQWYAGFNYYGMRFAQICNIWKKVWGADSGRVVCVLATQAASLTPSSLLPAPGAYDNSGGVGYQDLNCPLAISTLGKRCYQFADAIAIAPYFGYNVPDSWTTQSDGGLTSLFTEITQGGLAPGGYPGGMIKQALGWTTAWTTSLKQYGGLPLIAYEGGQSLIGSKDAALTTLYAAANRNRRMGAAYAQYLQGWKAAGGGLFANFSDVGPSTAYGAWGVLESVMDKTSPKYDALTRFIAANPCWWPACTLSSARVSPRADVTVPSTKASTILK
ncbi:MAG: hypothetical protein ACYC5H_11845 [Methylovirgula sp.]